MNYYGQASSSGRTYEVGAWWVWPVALKAQTVLKSIGVWVGVDLVAGWVAGSFFDPASANASGDAVSDATRAYYLGDLDAWAQAAGVKVSPARRAFVLPVIARAQELMNDPGATHADLVSAIKGVAWMVEEQANLSGTPLDEPDAYQADADDDGIIIEWSTFEVLDAEPAPGVPTPLDPHPIEHATLAGRGPSGWLTLGAVALGGWFLWRRYAQ